MYYRSHRGMPVAPGRILWYSSGRDREVVACSRLVEAMVGAPERLYREFKRFGVWDLSQVQQTPRRPTVGVLRFADTAIFERPLALARLRSLRMHVATLPSQGPVKIPAALFGALYREGRTA